jgi:uncharacterized Fe-S cluster protein YjdI
VRASFCLLLVACADGRGDLPRLLETGWFEPDTADYTACAQRVIETVPADGATGWYWRTAPTLLLDAPVPGLEARLTDAGGA